MPFVALALSRVRQADSGVASSVVNVAPLVGGSVGIAALGTVAWTIAAHEIHLTRAGGRADLPPRAPVDRHRGKTGRGESQRRRAAGRTAATGADRNCRARTISLGFLVRPLMAARSASGGSDSIDPGCAGSPGSSDDLSHAS